MLVTWIVCALGWVGVYMMPDIFEAKARVYVDADSRLVEVMNQVGIAPGVASRVFIVRQAMLGRPQLERVARETDLDLRARSAAEKEELILSLREKIGVSSGRQAQSRNLFTISFADRDRDTALAVVQTLLNTFVEDVLEMKAQGSEEVSEYLEDQLVYYQDLLSEAELQLANFKKQNVGLLPNDSRDIFARLQFEMDNLKELRTKLQIESDRRDELRRQLRSETPYISESEAEDSGAVVPGNATNSAISSLEARRSDLLLMYTERHPDVVAIDAQLKQLKEKRRVELAAIASDGSGMEGVTDATNPVYQSVQIALNESGVRIAGLRSQIAQAQSVVSELNGQVDTMPGIEAEYAELTRNYDQYRGLYNELLMQKERERMGSVGEERDVVTFNIIDPPSVGVDPVAPPRVLLLVGVLIVAAGAGVGAAFLLDQFRPVFHDAKTLRVKTGRPVLGVVSLTCPGRHRSQRLRELLVFTAASMALLTLFSLVVVFNEPGVRLMHQIIWQLTG
jgi:polysaccharide chain length determinant protein (PEP-CTERM system associated)